MKETSEIVRGLECCAKGARACGVCPYRSRSSCHVELLRDAAGRIRDAGFSIEYVDCTVVAQAPKMSAYIEEMRKNLAAACGIEFTRLNVKATTEEKMGFTGAMEGIAAHAVCLLNE